MIPIKDKKYLLKRQDQNADMNYSGEGVYLGYFDIDYFDDSYHIAYAFERSGYPRPDFFYIENIVKEVTSDTSGSCSPNICHVNECNCSIVNSKYYHTIQKQYEIMYSALSLLEDVASKESVLKMVQDTLKAVDKEWDKLYSKESND